MPSASRISLAASSQSMACSAPDRSVTATATSLEKGEDYAVKTHLLTRTTAGRNLLSVQLHHPSSESQVVTAQLVDGPAAHQLHVAFDFSSEICKRPFDAGLTRG